jgi:hypothetical protein
MLSLLDGSKYVEFEARVRRQSAVFLPPMADVRLVAEHTAQAPEIIDSIPECKEFDSSSEHHSLCPTAQFGAEQITKTTDANSTYAAIDKLARELSISDELCASNVNEEQLAQLKDTLTRWLKTCHTQNEVPSNIGGALTGIEGGSPCGCDPQPCCACTSAVQSCVYAMSSRWCRCSCAKYNERSPVPATPSRSPWCARCAPASAGQMMHAALRS